MNLVNEEHAVERGRMLKAPDVLKKLGISLSTLNRFIRRRKDRLPSVKIGRMRRFPADKLEWWIENLKE